MTPDQMELYSAACTANDVRETELQAMAIGMVFATDEGRRSIKGIAHSQRVGVKKILAREIPRKNRRDSRRNSD